MKPFKNFLKSFKLDKRFFYSFLADIGFWVAMALIFRLAAFVLNSRAQALSRGRTTEELREYLLSAAPEQLQAMAGQMQQFVWIFIISAVLFAIVFWALYSLSRKVIWSVVLKKKLEKKKYWKWNWLNTIVLCFFVLTVVVYGIVKIILARGSILMMQVLMAMFFLAFFYLMFLVYYSFIKKYEVWAGVGDAFKQIKEKFKPLAVSYVFALLTLIALAFLLMLLATVVPQGYLFFLNAVVVLAFLAWLRLYVVEVLA